MKFGRAMKMSLGALAAGVATLLCAAPSAATIQGLKDYTANPVINLIAGADYLSTGDGGSHRFWGFGPAATGQVQYPGPTLILMQGATVTINVTNTLAEPVSLIFPGQGGLSTPVVVGGAVRSLGAETAPGQTRSYVFTASKPGTYVYESGTNMAKQVYLGLFGVIVVRPTGYLEAVSQTDDLTRTNDPEGRLARFAYGGHSDTVADTTYHREYLFIQTELDPRINDAVEMGEDPAPYIADYHDVVWMYNGRAFPDTLFPDFTPILPSQPYGSLATSHAGEKVLVRLVTMGREAHPFHMHGNHTRVIAHDGNLLRAPGATTANRSYEVFTLSPWSGQTYDGIWDWTGADLNWDAYGDATLNPALAHTCSNPACPDTNADGFDDGTGAACYDATSWEYCPDHGRPFPTALPDPQVLTFGAFFSGTPFMGSAGFLPPGEGGFNPYAGFFFMWHSHTEGELSNNDIFPGGMITMMGVLPMSAPVSY